MKRFTETLKWGDVWYRKLSPSAKLLWQWILDNCDPAGVIEPDLELATFQIGLAMGMDTLCEMGDRLLKLDDKKFLIVKFIEFQYGELSSECKGHNPVFSSLKKHGLSVVKSLDGRKNVVKCADGQKKPLQQIKGMQPLSIPPKTGQDKDRTGQDKDKEGGCKGETSLEIFSEIEARVGKLFSRPKGQSLSYVEQSALSEISRRPDALKELEEIEAFQKKPDNFFPQTAQSLLTNWQPTLDRARTHEERKKSISPKGFIKSQLKPDHEKGF